MTHIFQRRSLVREAAIVKKMEMTRSQKSVACWRPLYMF